MRFIWTLSYVPRNHSKRWWDTNLTKQCFIHWSECSNRVAIGCWYKIDCYTNGIYQLAWSQPSWSSKSLIFRTRKYLDHGLDRTGSPGIRNHQVSELIAYLRTPTMETAIQQSLYQQILNIFTFAALLVILGTHATTLTRFHWMNGIHFVYSKRDKIEKLNLVPFGASFTIMKYGSMVSKCSPPPIQIPLHLTMSKEPILTFRIRKFRNL